jgi:hypothetical protein
VAATNARDVDRQMSLYNQRVNAYYLTRNVPRRAVRAEKERVFGRVSSVDVRLAAPQITVSPDGRSAVTRFHKRYAISGNGQARSGEVLQELRWERRDGRWNIVSERDLKVIQ